MTLHITEVKKELANALTHGMGFLLSLVGVPLIISLAVRTGHPDFIWSTVIYSFCLMLVYISSTLYHAFPHPLIKNILRTFDHVSIYFLIAGSYTPFIIFYFNDRSGHILLLVSWSITFLGTVFKVFFTGKHDFLSTILYLAMGWMIVFMGKRMFTEVPHDVLIWIVVGGISYTLGIVFYLWKVVKYHHAIWHLFVLGGSIAHFIAVMQGLFLYVPKV
jgi:hemolysin III